MAARLGHGPSSDLAMAKTILIVEDNELNMKLFNDLLERSGHATLRAKTGVEAVALARAHNPDLILMDIQLPEVSGLQVTRWIKDDPALSAIPVIAVTAFTMKGTRRNVQGGCEPISPSPFGDEISRHRGELPQQGAGKPSQ